MDKFSRTTEIDTAGVLSAIEEETPKKSRKGNIIALIICVFLINKCFCYRFIQYRGTSADRWNTTFSNHEYS